MEFLYFDSYTYGGGGGGTNIPTASPTHEKKLPTTSSTPIAVKIFLRASFNSITVRPSSALHISAKLRSVTSCPFISTVKPAGDANVSVRNSKLAGFIESSKQASISSVSSHASTGGCCSSTTVLLLLFMHMNLKSLI